MQRTSKVWPSPLCNLQPWRFTCARVSPNTVIPPSKPRRASASASTATSQWFLPRRSNTPIDALQNTSTPNAVAAGIAHQTSSPLAITATISVTRARLPHLSPTFGGNRYKCKLREGTGLLFGTSPSEKEKPPEGGCFNSITTMRSVRLTMARVIAALERRDDSIQATRIPAKANLAVVSLQRLNYSPATLLVKIILPHSLRTLNNDRSPQANDFVFTGIQGRIGRIFECLQFRAIPSPDNEDHKYQQTLNHVSSTNLIKVQYYLSSNSLLSGRRG